MNEKPTPKQTLFLATMLFGMFFGAGNLIFPVYMGQLAGRNIWPAIIGFLITGVGLPLLGVAAIGLSRSNGLIELSSKVSRRYGIFFTCALYLTIGPFFAIPRCATVPFTVAITPIVGKNNTSLILALFSLVFFAVVLAFSLKPTKILTYVGKILTPVFLVFLGILVISALVNPITPIGSITPTADYESNAFFKGFIEGYNTMDALAGLAFGIVVVNVIRGLGITRPEAVAKTTAKSGVFSCIIMAIIYLAVTFAGAQSYSAGANVENGGDVLVFIASHYFGAVGAIIIAVTVTLACLKTSVGLVTSCAETFVTMFPKGPSYKVWAIIFSVVSFLIANLGLTAIIAYSLPVLMLLYPLAITLILLGLFGKLFNNNKYVYRFVTGFTAIAAVFDFIKALPENVISTLRLDSAIDFAGRILPFYNLGLGWICPAAVGLIFGLIFMAITEKKQAQNA